MQVRAKKDYTPFPPPQKPSKVDLQMESGEYFLSKEIKEARAAAERRERQAAKVQARKAQREAAYAAPEVLTALSSALRHTTTSLSTVRLSPVAQHVTREGALAGSGPGCYSRWCRGRPRA